MTYFSAADLARFCDVDLKTIHNWAARGALPSHRTPGRHLRFHRLDIIEFLTAYGHAVPKQLDAVCPRVVMACVDAAVIATARRGVGKRAEIVAYDDAFEAIADLGRIEPEAFFFDVTLLGSEAIRCVRRLSKHPPTRHIRLVPLAQESSGLASELLAAGAQTFIAGFGALDIRIAIEGILNLA
jgi:excisionase family DNA binding protein